MATFEFFSKEPFIIKGKFADYVDKMWVQNKIQESYFKRLVDLYTIAAIVGLRIGRKLEEDNSTENKRTVQLDAISSCKLTLTKIMRLVILFDDSDGSTPEKRLQAAFKIPESEDVYKKYMNLFNSYVRGGIEYLYEQIIISPVDIDDDYQAGGISNILSLLKKPLKKDFSID